MTAVNAWTRPLPTPSPLTRPFWEATKAGRLVLQRCTTCHAYVWTPQPLCRNCLTDTLEWSPVSGRGAIYSYVVIERPATPAFKAPYAIVIVDLEEGPRILSDMVECEASAVRIGMPVEVKFEPDGEVGLYHFRPRA
jgi:uncharacterized protein